MNSSCPNPECGQGSTHPHFTQPEFEGCLMSWVAANPAEFSHFQKSGLQRVIFKKMESSHTQCCTRRTASIGEKTEPERTMC